MELTDVSIDANVALAKQKQTKWCLVPKILFFHEFLHTMYKYVLNSVIKMSVMFAQYFEYYAIILRGPFFSWTHYIYIFGGSGPLTEFCQV